MSSLVVEGRHQKLTLRRATQERVGGRVRKSEVLKFAPGVELISGSNPVYFVQVWRFLPATVNSML
jgi:hypothetical protein